jgi:dihydrofolate reductase
MRKLTVFNNVSLDGYFVDRAGDMSWAHKQDDEWAEFTTSNASGDAVLVFGRVTYEMMASFWPTPQAAQTMPEVAERMNSLPKIVFSRTLESASWQNTTLITNDIVGAMRRLKAERGADLVIFGSGTIVAQFTDAHLIDEYQVVVNPLVLGAGRTMFDGVRDRLGLQLTRTRAFKNGNVVLWYAPAAS